MQTILALTIFAYCTNTFLVFIGSALGMQQVSALAIPQSVTQNTIDTSLQTLNSTQQGGFNTSLIFGDWVKPINTFIALISLQGIVNLIGTLGGAFGASVISSFIGAISVVFGVLGIASLIYLVSGRGALMSI